MSEANKTIARRMSEEVWNQGNLDAADELCAPDIVVHGAASGLPPGREGLKQFIGMYRAAFPDLKVTADFTIAEGDKVVQHWTSSGTHKGDLMGMPATGKKFEMTGLSISRIVDGKTVEVWNASDQLGMMQQLGAIPS